MAEEKRRVRRLTGRHRGLVLSYPKSEAEYLVATGQGAWAEEAETRPQPEPETPESPTGPTEDDLGSLTKDELVALAESRGVEVGRADGEDGAPLKSDYVRALSDA